MFYQVSYIPILPVKYAIDLVVENLTLSGRHLFPNIISIEVHNFIKFSLYSSITDEHHHQFTLTFAQMQADMRDIVFYFRMKTGLKISDSGLADVILSGEGLTVSFRVLFSLRARSSSCRCYRLPYTSKSTLHPRLETRPFLQNLRTARYSFRQARKRSKVEGLITTGMVYVGGQLVGVRDRMANAKVTEGKSRSKVLRICRVHYGPQFYAYI
jgi:hypothetical protein